eukprot:gene16048-17670_t
MDDQNQKGNIELGHWNCNTEINEHFSKTIKVISEQFQKSEGLDNWFGYAPDCGHEEFRTLLAKFLTEQYGAESPWSMLHLFCICSSDILPTHGATSGLKRIASLFFRSGSLVFCENPVFGPSAKLLRNLGMELVPVKIDENGMDIDELEKLLKANLCESKQTSLPKTSYTAMLYLIPVLQNPTGVVLSKERCEKVINLARKYNLLVACDDVYNTMYFDDEYPPPRLFSLDKKNDSDYGRGHVVSIGTFSKLLVPALKIGWLEAPNYVIETIVASGENLGSGSPAGYMQGMITTALKNDLIKDFITKSKMFYKLRLKFFISLLQKYFPQHAKYSIPKGGFFVWISFPESFSSKVLFEYCSKHNVTVQPGSTHSADGSFDNCIRLCPTMCTEEELEFAVKTISEFLSKQQ